MSKNQKIQNDLMSTPNLIRDQYNYNSAKIDFKLDTSDI